MSNSGTSEVDTKPNFQANLSVGEKDLNSAYIEIRSDSSDNYSDENTVPTQIVGNRRYIRETVFDNVEKKNCEHVPEEIVDICVFIVPLKKGNLNYCKGKRLWGPAQSGKINSFSAESSLLFNCRWSYCCKNPVCKNIVDFAVNCRDFERLNDRTICALCGKEASFISYDARLILEEDLVNKIIMCKHISIHSCRRYVDGRERGV